MTNVNQSPASDKEALQRYYDSLNARVESGSGTEFWKIPIGKSSVRIAPVVPGAQWWFHEKVAHWNLGPGKVRALCPTPFGKPCPVDEVIDAGQSNPSISKTEAASLKEILPKSRVQYYIVDYADLSQIQIMDTPLTVLRDLQRFMLNDEYGNFTDLQTGRDVLFERTGRGQKDTKYNVMLRPSQTPAPDVLISGLQTLTPLHTLEEPKTYEEIQALMFGTEAPAPAPQQPAYNPTPAPAAVQAPAPAPQPIMVNNTPYTPPQPTQDGISAPMESPVGQPMQNPNTDAVTTGVAPTPVQAPTPVTAPQSGFAPGFPVEVPPELQECYGKKWAQIPTLCPTCKLTQQCMTTLTAASK